MRRFDGGTRRCRRSGRPVRIELRRHWRTPADALPPAPMSASGRPPVTTTSPGGRPASAQHDAYCARARGQGLGSHAHRQPAVAEARGALPSVRWRSTHVDGRRRRSRPEQELWPFAATSSSSKQRRIKASAASAMRPRRWRSTPRARNSASIQTDADAEQQTFSGQLLEAGDLLGCRERGTIRQYQRANAKPDGRSRAGEPRQCDERVDVAVRSIPPRRRAEWRCGPPPRRTPARRARQPARRPPSSKGSPGRPCCAASRRCASVVPLPCPAARSIRCL